MACNTVIAGVSYSCDDLALGGLTKIYIGDKANLTSGVTPLVAVANDVVTITPASDTLLADSDVFQLEFNIKDGFSAFTDVKTIADGSVSAVPTITVEIPKMSGTHRDILNDLANPNAEIVAFIETAAGTRHLVGWDYGLFVSTVDGASGTSRSEKNRYQLTLTGEQANLSYDIAVGEWADVA
jgi:hypothetical protein